MKTVSENIDKYIGNFPKEIQILLKQIRKTIKEAAPDAEEAIKYAMPTFVLNGNLVHFAAHKNHIGFYPAASGVEAFKNELSDYRYSKGTIQFPIDKAVPIDLIYKIVKFRVKENLNKTKKKK